MKYFLILFWPLISLTGCSSGSVLQSPDGTWVMYSMTGVELNKDRLTKGLPVFSFDTGAGRFSGHDGCNQLMSSVTLSDDKITFKKLVHTEMACPHMEVENAVLKVLSENTLEYEVKDSVLILTSPDGTVMQFNRDQSD